jgi:hypothetical protein
MLLKTSSLVSPSVVTGSSTHLTIKLPSSAGSSKTVNLRETINSPQNNVSLELAYERIPIIGD